MEAKFQDLLKNIIPGFYILFGVLIVCYVIDIRDIVEITKKVITLPIELIVLSLPFSLFILGYINDIFSSLIEFWIYELKIVCRPSFQLLNNKKKRYKLSNIQKILDKLDVQRHRFNPIESYEIFQYANTIKKNSDEVKEFYLSYVFSRNLMGANLLVLLFTFGIYVFNFKDLKILICLLIALILFLLFAYRWKQRSLYYSKKVFNSVLG